MNNSLREFSHGNKPALACLTDGLPDNVPGNTSATHKI
jgi:hypothetical protein